MNFPELSRELTDLRRRFEALEASQHREIVSLREALEDLSRRLSHVSSFELEAEESVAAATPDPAPEPVLHSQAPSESAVMAWLEDQQTEDAPPLIPNKPWTRQQHLAPQPPPFPEKTEAAEAKGSFEMRFGREWLGRIGIAVLVTGLVLLGNFAYKNWIYDLPAIVRLLMLYLGAGGLLTAGLLARKKESTRRFSEVLLGGGLAFAYWCTYAAHHVPRLQVVASPVVGALLVLLAAAAITALSLRWKSRMIGLMGLVLASYSTMLQPLGWLSSVSSLGLALAGTAMMLRGGWAGPGIAAMIGSYASFFWWQFAGISSGSTADTSVLWFLPPVWAVFTLSMILGSGEKILSARGKAFFASANNIAFFLLFSGMWFRVLDRENYWTFAAAFGALLVGLNAVKPLRAAFGGLYLAQGLAALTLALVLKLEGYQLALGLAFQALSLGVAFSRFGGRSELTFGSLAAAGACFFCLRVPPDGAIWSDALVAALLFAAGIAVRNGSELEKVRGRAVADISRLLSTVGLILACTVLMLGVCRRLDLPWSGPMAGGIAVLMAAGWIYADGRKRFMELGVASAAFGLYALVQVYRAGSHGPVWPEIVVGGLAVLTHFLWSRPGRQPNTVMALGLGDASQWLTAVLVALAAVAPVFKDIERPVLLLWLTVTALGLAGLGRYLLKAPMLAFSAALLLPVILFLEWSGGKLDGSSTETLLTFIPLIGALGVTVVGYFPRVEKSQESFDLLITRRGGRFLSGVAWLLVCQQLAPDHWGDLMALTGLLLGVLTIVRKWTTLRAEMASFLGIGIWWLLYQAINEPWVEMSPAPFPRGWAAVLGTLVLAFLIRPETKEDKGVRDLAMGTGFALLTVWSSHLLVWHLGWKPAVVLWTILGFGAVSAGLWRKLAVLRQAGFALLAVAMAKLFILDVWDLGTFMRVVAFLALGAALVLLSFFYNRFAELLKKLFEEEKEGKE